MKSLDEVIKFFEKQEAIDKWEPRTAALHYLKEYRAEMDNIRIFHDDHIAMKNELSDIKSSNNPALTWDELKQMEGKPVWVEHIWGILRWGIIDSLWFDEKEQKEKISIISRHGWLECDKDEQGAKWQAYRRERKNENT